MDEIKLTRAQAELLAEAAQPGGEISGTTCVSDYKPARKLVEGGLARWLRDDASTHRLLATDAGRGALAKVQSP